MRVIASEDLKMSNSVLCLIYTARAMKLSSFATCELSRRQSSTILSSRNNKTTRHRASTSRYSLTFCVRFLLPERHQWKPAVQTTAVMLRTPPSAAGRPRPLPVCGAQFWGRPPSPAGRRRRHAQTPPSRPFALCRHIAGWMQACN